MLEVQVLIVFMILSALIAVQAKDLVSSVVAIGAVGIGLSMTFLVLKAPDLAITQLVVEILSLIMLVRATIRRDLPFSTSGRWLFNTIGTTIFIAAFLVVAILALKDLGAFGAPGMKVSKYYLDWAASRPGNENVVAVIMGKFRAIDTLGEMTVLFASIVGVLAVARKNAKE
ncbi:MAG TPA: DUF4040 domain-containing protein [Candidatus Omnitrophota bacterium]|nr:DUF4040 domain-containing protein [Candidatus Omnitrophota bacterium]